MGSIKLGKVLGFEIGIDWSWLFILFLVIYTLATGYFPALYPDFSASTNWLLGAVSAILLFVSVLVHEISHSLVARRYGTQVRGITLFLFGGVSQTADEPKSAREEFWMAIAGPLTSFALAALFYFVGGIGDALEWPRAAAAISAYLAFINLLLGVFNLVPGFPLDGGRVLRSIIWAATGNMQQATQWASYSGQGFAYLMVAIGLARTFVGDVLGGLWLVFIGWFLAGAARSSYQQVLVRQALSGVRVDQVMTTDVPVVDANMTVRQFVDEDLLKHEFSCYPVTRGEDVIGVVGMEEVRTIPSGRWEEARVGDIVHTVDSASKVDADDDAWDAVNKLASQDVCRLLVVHDNHLQGTVGRDTVYRLVRTKLQLGM